MGRKKQEINVMAGMVCLALAMVGAIGSGSILGGLLAFMVLLIGPDKT